MREYYESYMREVPCQVCHGRRLKRSRKFLYASIQLFFCQLLCRISQRLKTFFRMSQPRTQLLYSIDQFINRGSMNAVGQAVHLIRCVLCALFDILQTALCIFQDTKLCINAVQIRSKVRKGILLNLKSDCYNIFPDRRHSNHLPSLLFRSFSSRFQEQVISCVCFSYFQW